MGERAIRGIISQLVDAGHLISVEDKYVYELTGILKQRGAISSSVERRDLDLLVYFDDFDWDSEITNAQWGDFKTWLPQHVRALEHAVSDNELTLLSLRLSLGDTLYFWAAPHDIADKWQGRAVYAGLNTQTYSRSPIVIIAVAKPAWEDY